MPFTTLVTTATLAEHLGDPAVAVIDCRYNLADEDWGRSEFRERHVPGAIYAHLHHDLAGERTGTNGRHPLPDSGQAVRTFGRLGIGPGIQVIAYDQDAGMYASRLWWMLRWMGHDAVAVLDGGWARWVAEGRPVESGDRHATPRVFVGAPRAAMLVDVKDVAPHVGDPSWRLVDARAPERYRGEVEPIDRVPGHIPGAVNQFYMTNMGESGTFLPPDQLAARFRETAGGVPAERIICYCGSGVTACHNLLAWEHAGIRGVRLYPGSWSEWSSDPSRPVEQS